MFFPDKIYDYVIESVIRYDLVCCGNEVVMEVCTI